MSGEPRPAAWEPRPAVWPTRLLALAGAAAAAAYDPAGLDAFTDVKLAAWALALAAAGAAWASDDPRRTSFARLDGAVLLALATAAVCSLFSTDRTLSVFGPPHLRTDGLLPLLALAAGYGLARLTSLGRAPAPVFDGLSSAGLALGLGAVSESFGVPLPGLPVGIVDGRTASAAGSPVYLAATLAVVLPAALEGLRTRRGAGRAFAAAAAAACAAGLWLSRSRGGWAAAAAGAAVWGLAASAESPRLRRAALAAAAAALLLLPVLSYRRASRASSDAGRLVLWRASARLAAEKPAAGWGPGTLELALSARADEAFALKYRRRQNQASAHNDLLHAAAVGGVTALAALLLLWAALFLAARGALSSGAPAAAAAAGGLTALFVQAKVGPVPFGAAAAGALYAASLPRPAAGPPLPGAWALPVMLAFLALPFVRGVGSDRAHRRAMGEAAAGRFPEAERSLREAARLDPSATGPAFERTLLLLRAARAVPAEQRPRFAEAAVAAARALAEARPAASSGWHALGLALAERGGPGDLAEAASCLDTALTLDWRREGLLEARTALGPDTPPAAAARARAAVFETEEYKRY